MSVFMIDASVAFGPLAAHATYGRTTPAPSAERSAAASAARARSPRPDEPGAADTAVRGGPEGTRCRCTGYHNMVAAVLAAAGSTDTQVSLAGTDAGAGR